MQKSSIRPSPLRHWSALVPFGMSLAALAFVLIYAAVMGVEPRAPGADEGAPARIFQLWMLAQLPIVAYFAIHWLPRSTRQALLVLVMQGLAWLIPVATILFLESR